MEAGNVSDIIAPLGPWMTSGLLSLMWSPQELNSNLFRDILVTSLKHEVTPGVNNCH